MRIRISVDKIAVEVVNEANEPTFVYTADNVKYDVNVNEFVSDISKTFQIPIGGDVDVAFNKFMKEMQDDNRTQA